MAQPRYTYRRSFFTNNFTTGVKWLLIVNTSVFILTGLLSPQYTRDIMLLALAPVAVVKHFALWQLATYLFLHGGVWHLVFNMLTLWMFGTPLERDWGTRRFPFLFDMLPLTRLSSGARSRAPRVAWPSCAGRAW